MICHIYRFILPLLPFFMRDAADRPPALIQRHLRHCSGCQQFQRAFAELPEQLSRMSRSASHASGIADPRLTRRIMDTVEQERQQQASASEDGVPAHSLPRTVGISLGCIALLAVFVMAFWMWQQDQPHPEPDHVTDLSVPLLAELWGADHPLWVPSTSHPPLPLVAEAAERQMHHELYQLRKDADVFMMRIEKYWPVLEDDADRM